MKVKIPRDYECIVHRYKIGFKSNVLTDEQMQGYAHHRLQQIMIDSSLAPSIRDVCFNHEVLEVIKRHYGIDISHDDLDRIAQGFSEFLFRTLGIEYVWDDIKGEE